MHDSRQVPSVAEYILFERLGRLHSIVICRDRCKTAGMDRDGMTGRIRGTTASNRAWSLSTFGKRGLGLRKHGKAFGLA